MPHELHCNANSDGKVPATKPLRASPLLQCPQANSASILASLDALRGGLASTSAVATGEEGDEKLEVDPNLIESLFRELRTTAALEVGDCQFAWLCVGLAVVCRILSWQEGVT